MSSSLLDELHWLTEALRAHVQWSSSTGSVALPRCDAAWLEQRREHYRATPLREVDDEPALTAAEVPITSAEPPRLLEASPSAERSVDPSPTQPSTTARVPAEIQAAKASVAHASAPVKAALASLHAETPSKSPGVARPNQSDVKSTTARAGSSPIQVRGLDDDQKRMRLVTLEQQVQACTSCGLCTERKNPAFARGTGSSKIAFVGEGPGAEEDAQGIPFVGPAGQLLDRMIAAMGLARNDVYVCNIIKCRPPNNRKPSDDEIATCRHFVVDQLQLIEPQVIVALGATAVEGLLGLKLGITRLRGTWRLYEGRIPVMPTFHPAYLLRKPEAKREVWEDLQAVLTRINRSLPPRA